MRYFWKRAVFSVANQFEENHEAFFEKLQQLPPNLTNGF